MSGCGEGGTRSGNVASSLWFVNSLWLPLRGTVLQAPGFHRQNKRASVLVMEES